MIKSKKNKILLLILMVVILDTLLVSVIISSNLKMTNVWVAKREMAARTKISESDLEIKRIPKTMVNKLIMTDKNEILGKLVILQGKIPSGSLIYRSMIESAESAGDYPSLQLQTNQSVFSLPADLTMTAGNSIMSGQRVDLYVTLNDSNRKPIVDLLFSRVRVLSVKDKSGNEITKSTSGKSPSLVLLAVDTQSVAVLTKAVKIGKISLIASLQDYSTEIECILNSESSLLGYLHDE